MRHPKNSTESVLLFFTQPKQHIGFAILINIVFDCHSCPPLKLVSDFLLRKSGECVFSEYKIQGTHIYWTTYCLYTIPLTKTLNLDFQSAALHL